MANEAVDETQSSVSKRNKKSSSIIEIEEDFFALG